MLPFCLHAKTISDAWFQLIYNIFDYSYTQKIQKGSFENEQYRLQYHGMAVFIEHPGEDMIPIIPPALNIPSPTTMDYIEDYFANYLMDPELSENETYKYSSRIHHPMPKGGTQFERVIEILKTTPLTNQAVIEIGSPDDHDVCYGNDGKLDPPCLRLIDTRIRYGKLHFILYFRSWDLWGGFPSNLGGLELVKQYIAQEIGVENGEIIAVSKGLHLYDYSWELAKIRTNKPPHQCRV